MHRRRIADQPRFLVRQAMAVDPEPGTVSKAIIEPYLSDQWYVKVTDPRMAKAANEALVASQRTTTPANSTNPTRERGRTPTAHSLQFAYKLSARP